ncbi:MAG: hypothetical protein WA133_02330 [Syntrophales bacterium]
MKPALPHSMANQQLLQEEPQPPPLSRLDESLNPPPRGDST